MRVLFWAMEQLKRCLEKCTNLNNSHQGRVFCVILFQFSYFCCIVWSSLLVYLLWYCSTLSTDIDICRLRKNLKQLVIVHPTLWLKTVALMSRPFIRYIHILVLSHWSLETFVMYTSYISPVLLYVTHFKLVPTFWYSFHVFYMLIMLLSL